MGHPSSTARIFGRTTTVPSCRAPLGTGTATDVGFLTSVEDFRPRPRGLRLMSAGVLRERLEEAREVATMKALVMYESMFGNSERVARAVADGLGAVAQVVVLDVTVSLPG